MSIAAPIAARQHYDQGLLRSRAILRWRADWLKLDALGGPAPVFTRASTANGTASDGSTATYPNNYPCWSWANSRPEVLVDVGASDDIWNYAWSRAVGAFTVLLRFRQHGSIGANDRGFFYIGAAAEAGARIWIETQGSQYSMRMHNGTAEVNSTLSTAPTSNQEVIMRGEFLASGGNWQVRLSAGINGGAEATASASTAQAFSAHAASSRVYLGSLGGQNALAAGLREVLIARGTLTLAQIEDVF